MKIKRNKTTQPLEKQTEKRRGFSMIELQVLIAVYFLLMALLLPTVQKSRASARKTQCLNNIKQMTLACRNYADKFKSLPSGYIYPGDSDFDKDGIVDSQDKDANGNGTLDTVDGFIPPGAILPPHHNITIQGGVEIPIKLQNKPMIVSVNQWAVAGFWGWQALVLEEMGQKTAKINYKEYRFSPNNYQAMKVPVKSYTCPSAELPSTRPGGYAYSTYRGNLGYRSIKELAAGKKLDNGVLFRNSGVKLGRGIKDGESQTIMIGESLFGFWGDGYSCCARPRDGLGNMDIYWQALNATTNPRPQFFGFGSWHGNIAHFGMADGAGHAYSKKMDTALFRKLCTRNGGEKVIEDF